MRNMMIRKVPRHLAQPMGERTPEVALETQKLSGERQPRTINCFGRRETGVVSESNTEAK